MDNPQQTKVSPNCQALDLYTFANLTVIKQDNKQFFKCKLNEEADDLFITNAWIVGFITDIKIHKKTDDNNETHHVLDLTVSDGCHKIKVVQFKTSLSETDFQINQYYSFIVRPFISKPTPDQQNSIQNQGSLISYHKIVNFNEVSAHISESIRTFYFLLAPFPALIVKIIKAYSSNNVAISEENLKLHLRMDPSSVEYTKNIESLNQFINALKENGFIESNDQGYLMADQNRQS